MVPREDMRLFWEPQKLMFMSTRIKVINVEGISEAQAKEMLQLIPLIYKREGTNVFGGIKVITDRRETEKILLIDIVAGGRPQYDVRLNIEENGCIYVQDFTYEKIHSINTIPIIDYLRKENLILT